MIETIRARGIAISVFIVLFVGPGSALAQETVDPLEGQRVRLTLLDPPLNATHTGVLLRLNSDELVLRNPDGSAATLSRTDLLRIEVSNGGNGAKGALKGLGIGAALGLIGIKVWADGHYQDDEYNFLAAMIVGAPVGGLVGALVGASLTRERWLPVQLDVATGPGFRFGLRFTLRR